MEREAKSVSCPLKRDPCRSNCSGFSMKESDLSVLATADSVPLGGPQQKVTTRSAHLRGATPDRETPATR